MSPAVFFLRLRLPERSKHRIEVVVQIAFLERVPFVAIQPDAFATVALVHGKTETVTDLILDHAKATFGAVDGHTRLRERQTRIAVVAFRKIWTMRFQPLPVFSPTDPIATTIWTLVGGQI